MGNSSLNTTNKDLVLGSLCLCWKNKHFQGEKKGGMVLFYKENLYPPKGFVAILENNHFPHWGVGVEFRKIGTYVVIALNFFSVLIFFPIVNIFDFHYSLATK